MRLGIIFFQTVVGAALFSDWSASAQPAKKSESPTQATVPSEPRSTSAAFGDWVLVCQRTEGTPTVRICETSQSVQVQGQSAPLIQLAISKGKLGSDRRVTVVAPNNISLPSNPMVRSSENDPKPLALAWTRCLPGGCFAEADVADDVLRSWRDAKTAGRFTFADAAGRDLNIPISFKGLSQALDALAKE